MGLLTCDQSRFLKRLHVSAWRSTSSALSFRLPNSLRARARELAERESILFSQFVSPAVAEKLAALLTEEYQAARVRRGSRPESCGCWNGFPRFQSGDHLGSPRRRKPRYLVHVH